MLRPWLLGAALALQMAGACAVPATPAAELIVAPPIDEMGQPRDAAAMRRFAQAVAAGLRARDLPARAAAPGRRDRVAELRVLGCDAAACRGTVAVRDGQRVLFGSVAQAPAADGMQGLADAAARAITAGLHPSPVAATPAEDITATGAPVRHLGGARFAMADRIIDLRAIAHGHDPAIDPDVPLATDITLGPDPVAPGDVAVITLYQVDPPLTGLPSREPGIDRGTDFRDPSSLVKAAYSNYLSPVLTEEPAPVRVAGHPIGHFFVKVEIPGYPALLTGMTTIDRSDAELVRLTLGRGLGIGGVLLTPQPGRLNGAAEAMRELTLRQRRLRVGDGLAMAGVIAGPNAGPTYVMEDGRVVFARFRVPQRNATDALAFFVEHVARGGHERFGSLINRPFRGHRAPAAPPSPWPGCRRRGRSPSSPSPPSARRRRRPRRWVRPRPGAPGMPD